MSLDVYLRGPYEEFPCRCRECENEHTTTGRESYYSANITHNLGSMAKAAGIYQALWRPEELNITKAVKLVEPLRKGLDLLINDPVKFSKFNSENGWGLYEHFVPFVKNYLDACEKYPDATVMVSR